MYQASYPTHIPLVSEPGNPLSAWEEPVSVNHNTETAFSTHLLIELFPSAVQRECMHACTRLLS